MEALAANNTEKINELKYLQGSLTVLERVIGIILGTEMNAVVLNIKSGDGVITMPMQAECIKQVQTEPARFGDIGYVLNLFKSYGIYTIGRVTSFQDNTLAKYNEYQHAIKNPDGSIWLDDNRSAWVDPFNQWVQKYNIAAAKEAALAGFDEINFDYVRFPEGRRWGAYYTQYMLLHEGKRSDIIIHDFLKDAYEALEPYNVNVSADILVYFSPLCTPITILVFPTSIAKSILYTLIIFISSISSRISFSILIISFFISSTVSSPLRFLLLSLL